MRNLLIAGVLVLTPACLFADTLTLDWVSPGNNPVGYFYVSPYLAEVQSPAQLLTLYCIDFGHEVAPPYEWHAQIFNLDYNDVPNLQYGSVPGWTQAAAWTKYKTAAWLINQSSHVIGSGSAALHQEAVDQYAAWEVFITNPSEWDLFYASVGASGDSHFGSEIAAAYNSAVNAVDNGWQPVGWEVVTPYPAGRPDSTQEFLVDPVPEPSAVLLIATVAGGMLLLVRRRSLYPSPKPVPGQPQHLV
jgi:hypothetical protein